ncbi:MAG: RagB/SusD family nutrient uptake outer membrane protein [Balneolaceae bacterium]
MKIFKSISLVAIVSLFIIPACDNALDVQNPNEPTPEIVLSEEGLKRQATGLYDAGDGWLEWVFWQYHEHMGDNSVAPWVNNNFNRYHGNVELIIYNDGTEWSPVVQSNDGRTQPEWLEFINDRNNSNGGYEQEWAWAYQVQNEANIMLAALEEGVTFLGTEAEGTAKANAYKAWAHFWKGYSYSRIGLLHSQGLIVNGTTSSTNNDYVSRQAIIAESQRQYDLALETISSFDAISAAVVPAIFPTNLTAASMAQNINTLKARNILLGKFRDELTADDFTQVRTLTQSGLTSNDGAFLIDSDNATYVNTITYPYRMAINWSNPSARVVQVLSKNGDARSARFVNNGFSTFQNRVTQPNVNTPWGALPPYAGTNVGDAPMFFASAEENLMMQAEAELGLGDAAAAATLINTVRNMPLQQAGLPDLVAATEQDLRDERRASLFMRGLAFYDARRFNELKSRADGGGVSGVWVYRLDPVTQALVLEDNSTIYYNFVEYWDVPDAETDFNAIPGDGTPDAGN